MRYYFRFKPTFFGNDYFWSDLEELPHYKARCKVYTIGTDLCSYSKEDLEISVKRKGVGNYNGIYCISYESF